MSSSNHSSPIMKEEEDVAEIKRAMATGNSSGKDSSSTISSGALRLAVVSGVYLGIAGTYLSM